MAGVNEYSTTAASNGTVNSIGIAEGMATGGVNDAIRQIMADIASGLAKLKAVNDLTWQADRYPYFTSASAAALGTLTSFARTLLDDADAATARTTLGALASSSYTASDILTKLLTVDTNTSGLNADTLDGVEGSAYWSDSRAAQSLVGSGYQKLPSGLYIQWGVATTASSAHVVTFPIAFPNSCFVAIATPRNNPAVGTSLAVATTHTLTTITISQRETNNGGAVASLNGEVYWVAIGI